jgi:hypothetical protein
MCRSIGARARAFESVGLKCVLLEKTERKECLDRGTFWGGGGVFFRAYFFLLSFEVEEKIQKKIRLGAPSKLPRTELRRLSLSLLSPSLLIQSCAESYCRSIRPVKTWTF